LLQDIYSSALIGKQFTPIVPPQILFESAQVAVEAVPQNFTKPRKS